MDNPFFDYIYMCEVLHIKFHQVGMGMQGQRFDYLWQLSLLQFANF